MIPEVPPARLIGVPVPEVRRRVQVHEAAHNPVARILVPGPECVLGIQPWRPADVKRVAEFGVVAPGRNLRACRAAALPDDRRVVVPRAESLRPDPDAGGESVEVSAASELVDHGRTGLPQEVRFDRRAWHQILEVGVQAVQVAPLGRDVDPSERIVSHDRGGEDIHLRAGPAHLKLDGIEDPGRVGPVQRPDKALVAQQQDLPAGSEGDRRLGAAEFHVRLPQIEPVAKDPGVAHLADSRGTGVLALEAEAEPRRGLDADVEPRPDQGIAVVPALGEAD